MLGVETVAKTEVMADPAAEVRLRKLAAAVGGRQSPSRRVLCLVSMALALALVILVGQLRWSSSPPPVEAVARSGLQFGSLGVPWCRSKEAVPWNRDDLVRALREFVPVYLKRPIKNNAFGMGFDHSFGLWFIARQLQPELVVESGAFKGHSTWVMRQAMPKSPIVSISPRHPEKYLKKGAAYVDRNCQYFAGKAFIDFGNMDWDKLLSQSGIHNKSRVLVFFDDHQNQLKRMKQARKAGFQHLIFEDNYDTGTGDHYSLRQICDQVATPGGGHNCSSSSEEARLRLAAKPLWEKAIDISDLCGPGGEWWGVKGEMRDNFNHSNVAISIVQHAQNAKVVQSMLELYWELPPVASPRLTKQKRYDPSRTTPPLLGDEDKALFNELKLNKLEKKLFNGYTQMAYVRLSSPYHSSPKLDRAQ